MVGDDVEFGMLGDFTWDLSEYTLEIHRCFPFEVTIPDHPPSPWQKRHMKHELKKNQKYVNKQLRGRRFRK